MLRDHLIFAWNQRVSRACRRLVGYSHLPEDPDHDVEVSWNGKPMAQVYPWGTVRTPTTEANRATADELSDAEKEEIRRRTQPFLDLFGYSTFLPAARRSRRTVFAS